MEGQGRSEDESRQSSGPGEGSSLLPAASPRCQVKPDSDDRGAKVETYQPQTEGVGGLGVLSRRGLLVGAQRADGGQEDS